MDFFLDFGQRYKVVFGHDDDDGDDDQFFFVSSQLMNPSIHNNMLFLC